MQSLTQLRLIRALDFLAQGILQRLKHALHKIDFYAVGTRFSGTLLRAAATTLSPLLHMCRYNVGLCVDMVRACVNFSFLARVEMVRACLHFAFLARVDMVFFRFWNLEQYQHRKSSQVKF